MSTLDERVAAGCALLDRIRPGWFQEIDLAVLDMGDCHVCVVGQLAGADAEAGLWALTRDDEHLSDYWPAELGFNNPLSASDDTAYRALNDAWRHVIEARQGVS